MSFCFSHLPLCLPIEFYTFYLIGLAYFFSSLLLDILSFYCNCSFTFFFPLLYLFYESGLVSQQQEILLGILVQEDIMWELVSDLLEVSRSKRRRDFYLEIRKLLTREPGVQSLPCLLYWKSNHCPCWTSNEGPHTGVSGVLSCLSPTPCNSSLLRMPPTERN